MFHCHKNGHLPGECRAPTSNDTKLEIKEEIQANMAPHSLKTEDDLLIKLSDTGFKAATYKKGLATLEDQIVKYKEHEVCFFEEIALLKRSVGSKEYELRLLRTELEKVKQEKEGVDFKIAKFDKSAKNLNEMLESQITDKSKKGVGYHAVPSPHPLILNRPTTLDLSYLGLEEFKEPEVNEYGPRDSSLKPTTGCDKESNNSKENTDDSLEQHQMTDTKTSSFESPLKVDKDWKEKFFYPTNHVKSVNKIENQVRKNNDAPIIEDWVSNDENEVESYVVVEKKTVIPTAAKIEKPVRKSVKYAEMYSCPNQQRKRISNSQLNDKGFVDSGCSRHMTGNMAHLSDFKDFDGGYVTFGGGAYRGRMHWQRKRVLKENIVLPSDSSSKRYAEINTSSREVSTSVLEVNTANPEDLVGPGHASEDTQVEDQEVEMGNITQSYAVPTTPHTRIPQRSTQLNIDWKEAKKFQALENEAIRMFLAYASYMGFMVYQMDVKSTFLYGQIEEEVYVCQPPGFEDPDHPDKVYKVVKALYGLHQAPRAWYDTLATYLLSNGFQRGKIDQTLFIKRQKGHILLVQIYVDDIIFGFTKKELCDEFEKLMKDKFQMSSMRELTFFLGLQVQQKKKGIFISQDKYVYEILRKFNYLDVKSASTPTDLEKPLVQDGDDVDVDEYIYRSMIGSLMYLTASRPDIMFADSLLELVAYTDSDYAGATLDRKSTTRVATSTTETEYVATASCYGQHNMVAFLEKSTGSEEFHQVIDFVTRSHICYALTKKPDVCVSFIKQFWRSAEVTTDDNGEVKITATIDGHSMTITEASLRRHLKLDDQDGLSSIPNSEIFEQLALMGYHTDSDKLTFQKGAFSPQWRFLIHSILHCISPKKTAWEQFSSNIATAVICLATNRRYNFSRMIFEHMVSNISSPHKFLMYPRFIQICLDMQRNQLQQHTRTYPVPSLSMKVFNNMKRPTKGYSGQEVALFPTMLIVPEPSTSPSRITSSPSHSPEPSPSPTHSPTPDNTTAAPTQPSPTQPSPTQPSPGAEHHLPTPNESPLHAVHSHGSDEGRLKLNELTDLVTKLFDRIGVLEDDLKTTKQTYSSAFTKLILRVKKLEAQIKIGKARRRARIVHSDDEDIADDSSKQGRKLSDAEVQEKASNETEPVIQDVTPTEVIQDQESSEKGQSEVSTAGAKQGTASEVPIVSTAEVNLSTAGGTVTYTRRSKEQRIRKDKGKAIMTKLQEQLDEEQRAQIARDEEIARQWDEEERQRAMSEAKASKKIDWNDPSVIRYHALKMKPKTIAQARRNMIKYLKNQGNYKISDFKGMSYNEIRPIFEKVWDFNQHIEPMDVEHGSEKMKSPEKIEEEDVATQKEMKEVSKESGAKRKKSIPRKSTRKRQKMEEDAEKEELKGFLDIIPREEVPIEVESLSTKFPIVDWKTCVLTENFMYYQIFRGDGSSKNYKILSEMLKDFDRQDVEELYRLVKERYSASRPEGYDLMLWGDLHTLFEPDEEDELWKNQHEYNVISWSLYDFCGIHILLMQNGIAIHMLTEKKYPLSQEMISKMLKKKLEVDHESSQAFELLRIDQGVGSSSGIRACALRYFDLEEMELENSQNNALAKLPMLKLGEFDDLYQQILKIVEQKVKKSTGAVNDEKNLAFLTTTGASSINKINTVNLEVSTVHEDLEQLQDDDLEEMDLKLNMALLSMRARNGAELIGVTWRGSTIQANMALMASQI
ncbi:putative ribonuclease H-like domain-containing protein [Tanacetum coccineum]